MSEHYIFTSEFTALQDITLDTPFVKMSPDCRPSFLRAYV